MKKLLIILLVLFYPIIKSNAEEKNITIRFSKELTIRPKNGEIIIFPHSWYFPCNIETQEDLIYIYGNINT